MRWPWRRRKAKPVEPPPAPDPEPVDDYERDPRTRQGHPGAMRCRLCNSAKVVRRVRYPDGSLAFLLYCVTCDTQLPTPRKD